MPSKVVRAIEWNNELEGGLAPEQFNYRFLVEGDSWMDVGSPMEGALAPALTDLLDRKGLSALFVNIAQSGDTLQGIAKIASGELSQWLNLTFSWRFHALLLSAGGNDMINAALDPPAGQGILNAFAPNRPPAASDQLLNKDQVAKLVEHMDYWFGQIHERVRSSISHPDLPIFLNNYDTPTARNAPVRVAGKIVAGPWLYSAYTKNGIPDPRWPDLTEELFNDLQTTIATWAKQHDKVFRVPTDGTLTAAAPRTPGNSNDWRNEIHPNKAGWDKLAKVWWATLEPNI